MQSVRAFVGLGANLGDARATLAAAVEAMRSIPGTSVAAVSSCYRTAPVDASGPDFFNAVAAVDTRLDAVELLAHLQRIESVHGRERPFVNAPRTLDLDLLVFGGEVIDTPALVVPHPRLHLRAFALAPLAELAPGLVVAGRGSVVDLLGGVTNQRIDKLPK